MAETKNYTEEEAYGMLQTALLTGQDALDSLPDDGVGCCRALIGSWSWWV